MQTEDIKKLFDNWQPVTKIFDLSHNRGSKKGEVEKVKMYQTRTGRYTASINYAFEDYLTTIFLNTISNDLNLLDYESKKQNI